MTEELSRLARHGALILVTWAVARGWVPPALQAPVIEFATIALTLVGTIWLSKASDQKIVKKRDRG